MMQEKVFGAIRILFGGIWAIDASFKWQPAFINNLSDYLSEGAKGQPESVQWWINLWVHTISIDPHFFAILVALGETSIAIGLLFGLFTKIAMSGGIAMALVIWSTAEGFGGPYVAGSTDVGAAIIYALLFLALWAGKCWRQYSLDARLRKSGSAKLLFGRW